MGTQTVTRCDRDCRRCSILARRGHVVIFTMSCDASRLLQHTGAQWARCDSSHRRAAKAAPTAQMLPFRSLVSRYSPAQQSNDLPRQALAREPDGRQLRTSPVSPGITSAEALPIAFPSADPGQAATAAASATAPSSSVSIQASEPLQAGSTRFVAETRLPTRTGAYRVRAYRHTV